MSAKFLVIFLISVISNVNSDLSIVLNTWTFTNATVKAWEVLANGGTPLDALVEGCSVCEREQCDGTVGYGGSPDEDGETTLDAMIMDGSTMNVGAVANLRQVKDAIAVARHVLLNTKHSLLAGDQATSFAVQMGFKKESLSTAKSKNIWKIWKAGRCQPNFWEDVKPNPLESCGPYEPANTKNTETDHPNNISFGRYNHDTIGMIVIDKNQKIYAGTSTNGANHKIPGRVGDSPIPGAGAYADNEVGAAAATGDGDVMMRFLPAFLAVENLRSGQSTEAAARNALMRILKYYPNFFGGLIIAKNNGEYGAACSGMKVFPFSVYKEGYKNVNIEYVECLKLNA